MATSEDYLQTMAYRLNLIAIKHKMTISSTKPKAMAKWGNQIQGGKIVINDNIIKKINKRKSCCILLAIYIVIRILIILLPKNTL